MVLPALDSPGWRHTTTTFLLGVRAVGSTILTLVLFATYLGIGALAHDSNFSMGWALAGTLFVCAGPEARPYRRRLPSR